MSRALEFNNQKVIVQNNFNRVNYYAFDNYRELKELQAVFDVGCWKVKQLKVRH